jgi:hypothetical protein
MSAVETVRRNVNAAIENYFKNKAKYGSRLILQTQTGGLEQSAGVGVCNVATTVQQ